MLIGTSGNDVAVLGDGADVFDGLGGNDVVCGEDGRDLLVGGPGDDLLDGGLGNDQLRGDIVAAAGDATGDGGNDTLYCGDGGDDRANGDNLAVNGSASGNGGNDAISGCERSTGDNFALTGLASGDGGDDTIAEASGVVGDNNGVTTAGTGGNDRIIGTSRGDDPMIGDNTGDSSGGGTDHISGLQGPDVTRRRPRRRSLRRRTRQRHRRELRNHRRHPIAQQQRALRWRRNGIGFHLQSRGPRKPRTREQGVARSREIGLVTRAVYVPADEEPAHLTRDADGLPLLRLVDSGDRLSVWSKLGGGALLNPKGTGLRRFGLLSTDARGSKNYASAYRAADLRMGKPVELRREPENPHDRSAITMYAPG